MMDIKEVYLQFFDKKSSARAMKNDIMSNKDLAEELHQPIIRNFKKRKVHSVFIHNIWSTDLISMQLTSKFNKGFRFWLCVLLTFIANMRVLLFYYVMCYVFFCYFSVISNIYI